ncbi:cytochrome P450 [Amycolatopsis sp., V23-08]|uniref:Cytochrome P450 n=1 Tax=Amycolatopsis heterodermiae TaxID=3110235 RepID=A0ABU5R9M8_9PSEU|nr:cytochrome P450 [Amycolatopsis sp., V23-08]MEA5362540.1 cytochrome P450 [Amycolatopsis sp., V23-08]
MDVQSFTLPFERVSELAPPPAYADLRRGSPVFRTTTAAGTPAWVVIGAAEAQRVLSDRRFAITREDEAVNTESLMCDGEHHARLRRIIGRGLGQRETANLRPAVDALAGELVAAMRRAGPPADLVSMLCRPLTLAVITTLLGVPVDDRERFYRWADLMSVVVVDGAEDVVRELGELFGFLTELVETKRAVPGDDLLSALITVHDADDGRFNDRELVQAAAAVLAGGQVTTVNSLAIGVVKLLELGGGLGRLGDEQLIDQAVEEILRHQAGISGEAFPRWARADVELAGQVIAAGDMVIVRLEGANRDPRAFPDPDRFDPARTPRSHLRFGHGPHRCLGASVARMTLAAGLRALAGQVPGLALTLPAAEIPWTAGPLDRGPAEVIVTW